MIAALIALGVIAVLVLLFVFLPVVAWVLAGLVLAILALVLLLPIGADIGYVNGEFTLAARADGFTIQLIPRRERKKEKPPEEKKEKTPKEEKAEPEEKKKKKPQLDFTPDEILELIKKLIHGLGKFGKLTVRYFMLHYVAAGKDPYNTAMTFGYVNAALSVLAPLCAKSFHIKGDVDVRTDVDFAADKMQIDAQLSLTLRLLQIVHAALAAAFGALGVLIRHKLRRRKQKGAAEEAGPAEPPVPERQEAETGTDAAAVPEKMPDGGELYDLEPIIKENIQAEERNDSHG